MSRNQVLFVLSVIATLLLLFTGGVVFLAVKVAEHYNKGYLTYAQLELAHVQYVGETEKVREISIAHPVPVDCGIWIRLGDQDAIELPKITEQYVANYFNVETEPGDIFHRSPGEYGYGKPKFSFRNGQLFYALLVDDDRIAFGATEKSLKTMPFTLKEAVEIFGPIQSRSRIPISAP